MDKTEELVEADAEVDEEEIVKEENGEEKFYVKIILIIVCWLAGFTGIHRFIKKYWKSGLIFLFTGGLFGIGWAFDLIWLILEKELIFAQ